MTTIQQQTEAFHMDIAHILMTSLHSLNHSFYTGKLVPDVNTHQIELAKALCAISNASLVKKTRQAVNFSAFSPAVQNYFHYNRRELQQQLLGTKSKQDNTNNNNNNQNGDNISNEFYKKQLNIPQLPPQISVEPIDAELDARCKALKSQVEHKRQLLQEKIKYMKTITADYYDEQLVQALSKLEIAEVESTEKIKTFENIMAANMRQVENIQTTTTKSNNTNNNNSSNTQQNQQLNNLPQTGVKLIKRRRFKRYLPPPGTTMMVDGYNNQSSQQSSQNTQTKAIMVAKKQQLAARYYQNRNTIITQLLTRIYVLKHLLSFACYRTNLLISNILFNATSIQNILTSLQMVVSHYNNNNNAHHNNNNHHNNNMNYNMHNNDYQYQMNGNGNNNTHNNHNNVNTANSNITNNRSQHSQPPPTLEPITYPPQSNIHNNNNNTSNNNNNNNSVYQPTNTSKHRSQYSGNMMGDVNNNSNNGLHNVNSNHIQQQQQHRNNNNTAHQF